MTVLYKHSHYKNHDTCKRNSCKIKCNQGSYGLPMHDNTRFLLLRLREAMQHLRS